jgi:hypothetical protein
MWYPANSVFSSDPMFSEQTDPKFGKVYTFYDLLLSGVGTIDDGDVLVRAKARVEPGANGKFHIGVFNAAASALTTTLYSNLDELGDPVEIASVACGGGTVTFAPEPSTWVALATGCLTALVMWRTGNRRKAQFR